MPGVGLAKRPLIIKGFLTFLLKVHPPPLAGVGVSLHFIIGEQPVRILMIHRVVVAEGVEVEVAAVEAEGVRGEGFCGAMGTGFLARGFKRG